MAGENEGEHSPWSTDDEAGGTTAAPLTEGGEEGLVDSRVKGAIEGLNSAIDRVNLIEDEKTAISTAASRAASVVSAEMEAIEKEHRRLAPMLVARQAAETSVSAAKSAEQAYARTLDDVQMAREALHVMHSDSRHTVPSRDPGVREMERHLQEKLASCVKRATTARLDAKRTKTAADKAVRHVNTTSLALQRKSTPELEQAMQSYEQQRSGLQHMLLLSNHRLYEIETSKQEAVDLVNSAMNELESLSNELHGEREVGVEDS